MSNIEQIPVKTIDGKPATLGDYVGKVRLVVNVASQCGLTPQYAALQALYLQYQAAGLTILAFPANEFGAQEPGSDAEIKEFCSAKYDVTFPLFSKIVVKGAGQHPLYAALTAAKPQARTSPGSDFRDKLKSHGIALGAPHEITWNFEKFLVSRGGNVIDRFAPDVAPDAPILISAVEQALAH